MDYQQSKANGAADALSRFSQKSTDKKMALQAENTQILHRLQSLQPIRPQLFKLPSRPIVTSSGSDLWNICARLTTLILK